MIALLGNPNCGKTTLFNVLTGALQHVGNWAGVTTTLTKDVVHVDNQRLEIVDLPGIYTLTTMTDEGSDDEAITINYLKTEHPSIVLNVIDAASLERNLYVTLQCLEQQLPVIVALNRMDVASEQGDVISIEKLSEALGCPVYPLVARSGKGIEELKKALTKPPTYKPFIIPYKLTSEQKPEAAILIATARYAYIEKIMAKVVTSRPLKSYQNKIDKIICDKWLGLPIFLAIMYGLFCFAINIGGFFQEYVEYFSDLLFVEGLSNLLSTMHTPSWLMALMVFGVGKGVSTILTFIPVIGAMFLMFISDAFNAYYC